MLLPANIVYYISKWLQDCFILDTKTSGIYVWIGKKGTSQEKQAAMKNAETFLKQNNLPSWTQVGYLQCNRIYFSKIMSIEHPRWSFVAGDTNCGRRRNHPVQEIFQRLERLIF